METDNQIIIDLLREQNQTLHQLLAFHQNKERIETRNAIIHFIIQAIPYIALLIIVYILYVTLKGYMDIIHAQINSLQDAYSGMQKSLNEAIEKISSVPDSIGNAIHTLNPFN